MAKKAQIQSTDANLVTVIMDFSEPKKHSDLYRARAGQENPALDSIYVKKGSFDTPPKTLIVALKPAGE